MPRTGSARPVWGIWLLAVLLPPLAVYGRSRRRIFALSLLLTALGYLPGVIHASVVLRGQRDPANQRTAS